MSAAPNVDERFRVIRSIGAECVQDSELRELLAKNPQPICYDGFEPSGRMHLAQGILKAVNVNKLTSQGCHFIFWVADWFAQMNNKCGGDLAKIRTVGQYFIEVWKACGMDLANVEFRWTSEEISKHPDYWQLVIDIARTFSVKRLTRCSQIMGRNESDDLSGAQLFYPCMQCADIFFLKADICQLGLDQRKVNMLAREYSEMKHMRPPVILSHHMLMGLGKGQAKMAKRDENSAIFMEDTEDMVRQKVRAAFCPPPLKPGERPVEMDNVYTDAPAAPADAPHNPVAGNPIFDWLEFLIFPKFGRFPVTREEKDGGNKTYMAYEEVVADYVSGALTVQDLKAAVADSINAMLEPIRRHFEQPEQAALLAAVREIARENAERSAAEKAASSGKAPKKAAEPGQPPSAKEAKKAAQRAAVAEFKAKQAREQQEKAQAASPPSDAAPAPSQ